MGQGFSGKVVRAPRPMHGKLSRIDHTDSGLFAGLPNRLEATRYHSLLVDRNTLPDALEITAETDDGLIMGLAHRSEEHTSELQSLMRISYAVFCLKKKTIIYDI